MLRILFLAVYATANGLPSLRANHQTFQDSLKSVDYSISKIKAPPSFLFHLLKHKFKYPLVEKISTTAPTANCICVPYYQCNSNNTIITDGTGIINVRFIAVTFRRCTGDLEVCCRLPSASMAPIVTPTAPATQSPTTPTTMRPTQPPTTPTTMRPTQPPTTPTTMRPTQPPTTPTTMRPTQPPTTPTTMRPTQPPTTPTTMRPTQPPTTPTTMRPTQPPTTPTTMRPTQPPTTLPPTGSPSTVCICVPITQCNATGFIIFAGEGIIDPRQTLNPCPVAGQICCKLPTGSIGFPTATQRPMVTIGPVTVNPPVVQPVTCVCVKLYQCDANGYIKVSGAGIIDPRFPIGRQGQVAGTCVSVTEICCKIPAIDEASSVGFPAGPSQTNPAMMGTVKNPGTAQACACVKTWHCAEGNAVSVDGAGIIDPRFGACPSADEICCRLQGIARNLAAVAPLVNGGLGNVLIVNGNTAPQGTSAICGKRATTCLSTQACATKPGETSFAEFPWMVALLIRNPDGSSLLFQCGASIINTRSILTAAHCVIDRPSGVLVARFGEWNTANNDEPAPFQEADVQAVVTHPLYYNGGLYNDVAVLILATPITYALNVMPVCLPQQGMTFSPGTLCWASGWGRSAFQGQYQTILRKVDLPIVDRSDCQKRLRATRLGEYFQLHGTFICAGGEPSKDTCRGDGGGPLVCPTATGQFVQAGIVSWGIGCGESNTPAVYASVSQFRQWIDQQLANYGVL